MRSLSRPIAMALLVAVLALTFIGCSSSKRVGTTDSGGGPGSTPSTASSKGYGY